MNVEALIGTPVHELLAFAGSPRDASVTRADGGLMMAAPALISRC
nr:hypothetical protein [Pseudomonas aeruginosa]